ncbi:biliverdin-producing heme oxygenase [Dyadobacter bucti]|uniref:biliverdin-producing heme oxygenase n=1 Tax=Dyadobacter bucti TaxID=2572203 RepID=UPI00110975B4|nr:biliverdin-producing heme oxygenase [Dyadobacter bucti]
MNELTVSENDKLQFLADLRQSTAASHQKLEDSELSKAILLPDVTLAAYQTYLVKMYGVTKAAEDSIFPVIEGVVPDLDQRYKSLHVLEDLAKTGYPEEKLSSIPVFDYPFSSVSEALGFMYVTEGSTLGGRVLFKHIHQTLGLTAENGASYFWGYGPQTGILWKSFIAALTRFAVEKDESEKIIESAVQTFANIDNWLNEAAY